MFNPIFWFCLFLATAGSWAWIGIQIYGWMNG